MGLIYSNSEFKKLYGVGYLEALAWLFFLFVPAAVLIYGLDHYPFLDDSIYLEFVSAAFLIAVSSTLLFFRKLFPWANTMPLKIWAAAGGFSLFIPIAAFMLSCVMIPNGIFDKSKIVTVPAKVIDIEPIEERCAVRVHSDSWPDAFNYQYSVPVASCDRYKDSAVLISTKKGFLGIEWLVSRKLDK